MNVATALNRKYLYYTGVMLASLCENNPVHIDAYLLHSELTDEDLDMLRVCLRKYDISIHSLYIAKEDFTKDFLTNEMWSVEAYYRLMLLDILPEDVDRLFYFDVDIIINKSLLDVYQIDFDGAEIVACEDDCGMGELSNYGPVHKKMFGTEGLKNYRYFNSGVLLLNIASMRGKYNYQYYMQIAKNDWEYKMEAPDQDLLNYVHWSKVKYIPYEKYNLFGRASYYQGHRYQDVKDNVAIIHYTTFKPWDGTATHFDIEQIWWEYAKLTCFYEALMEDFVSQTMMKSDSEGRFVGLIKQNSDLKRDVEVLLNTNKRLMDMIKQLNA